MKATRCELGSEQFTLMFLVCGKVGNINISIWNYIYYHMEHMICVIDSIFTRWYQIWLVINFTHHTELRIFLNPFFNVIADLKSIQFQVGSILLWIFVCLYQHIFYFGLVSIFALLEKKQKDRNLDGGTSCRNSHLRIQIPQSTIQIRTRPALFWCSIFIYLNF